MKSIKKLSRKIKSKKSSRNITNPINGDDEKNPLDQTFDQNDNSEKSPNIIERQRCALCGKLTSNFVKAYLIRQSYYRCA